MFRIKAISNLAITFNKSLADNVCHVTRSLYAPATLGLEGFQHTKEKITQQLQNTDRFKLKMKEFSDKETSMIFTEDLKNIVHIASDVADTELVIKMIQRFNSQNKDLRFGNFVFGPVVMRMFYFQKDVESALKCFKDSALVGFFDQLMSYQILLDMLFEAKKYQEMLEIFEIIKTRQLQGAKYPKHVVVLTFAACYKINTAESLTYAMKLWQELNEAGSFPMRKGVCFVAALALNQNSPHIALEVVTTCKQQRYMTVRNIRAVCLAELNRPEDTIPILKSVLEVEEGNDQKQTFSEDIIERIKAAFKKVENKEIQLEFNKVLKFLSDNGHITNTNLDSLLCTEIATTAHGNIPTGFNGNRDKHYVNANFRNPRSNDNNRYNDKYQPKRDRTFNPRSSRPGLQDLY